MRGRGTAAMMPRGAFIGGSRPGGTKQAESVTDQLHSHERGAGEEGLTRGFTETRRRHTESASEVQTLHCRSNRHGSTLARSLDAASGRRCWPLNCGVDEAGTEGSPGGRGRRERQRRTGRGGGCLDMKDGEAGDGEWGEGRRGAGEATEEEKRRNFVSSPPHDEACVCRAAHQHPTSDGIDKPSPPASSAHQLLHEPTAVRTSSPVHLSPSPLLLLSLLLLQQPKSLTSPATAPRPASSSPLTPAQ